MVVAAVDLVTVLFNTVDTVVGFVGCRLYGNLIFNKRILGLNYMYKQYSKLCLSPIIPKFLSIPFGTQ